MRREEAPPSASTRHRRIVAAAALERKVEILANAEGMNDAVLCGFINGHERLSVMPRNLGAGTAAIFMTRTLDRTIGLRFHCVI